MKYFFPFKKTVQWIYIYKTSCRELQFQIVLICKCWRLFEMLLWSMQSRIRSWKHLPKAVNNNSGKVKNNLSSILLCCSQLLTILINIWCASSILKTPYAGYTRHPVIVNDNFTLLCWFVMLALVVKCCRVSWAKPTLHYGNCTKHKSLIMEFALTHLMEFILGVLENRICTNFEQGICTRDLHS